MAKFILDTRLSEDHYVICMEAIERGVIAASDLNEGQRLLSEQARFYANYLRFGKPLAAKPTPWAPHILFGRNNHAIDCNDGAADRLAAFYRSLGIPALLNTVAGEPWHVVFPDGAALKRAADKLREKHSSLRKGDKGKKVKYLKYQLHYIHAPGTRKPYFKPHGRKPKRGWGRWFDADLRLAVMRFQKDRKMKVDGVVGPATKKAIDAALKHAKDRRNK